MGSKVGYLKYRGEGAQEGRRGDPCKEGEEAPMAGVVGTYGGHHMPGASGGVVWAAGGETRPWQPNQPSDHTVPTNQYNNSQSIHQ